MPESLKTPPSKVFYGWWVVLATAVGLSMSFNPVITYSFGVFLIRLSEEFRWSRSEISAAYSISMLAFALAQPLIGRLVDGLGSRRVILPAVLVFGLALASLHFLSASIWHFYGVYLVMGLVGGGTTSVAYFGVLSRWFDKKRGLAIGLALAGNSLSAFVLPTLAEFLIESSGWRGAYSYLGLTVVLVAIPVVGLLFKERPESMGWSPDGVTESQAEKPYTLSEPSPDGARQAFSTATFWLLCTAYPLMSVSLVGCLTHLVPMLTDRGVSAQTAALATSVLGGAALLGRLGIGYLMDRFFAPYVVICFFCLAGVGIFLLWTGASGSLAFVAASLLGIAISSHAGIPYMVSRFFGVHAFGQIYGIVVAINVVGWMAGPLLMGVAFDLTGSYQLILGAHLFVNLTAIGLMTLLAARTRLMRDRQLEMDGTGRRK